MKKHIYLALIAALPIAAIAQPTTKKSMVFTAGTKVKMLNCNHIAPGPSGANKTWDFSSLTKAGGTNDTLKTEYSTPTTTPFAGANLCVKDADSLITYYQQSPSGLYMLGMVDSSSNGMGQKIYYTNSVLIMKPELSYNMIAKDTTADSIYTSGFSITGEGTVDMIVDGYGTLKLPQGTFNKVLRVRVEQYQKDTIPPPIGMSFESRTIRYMWFDSLHNSPLCIIDSTETDGSADQSASYLLVTPPPSTGVNDAVRYKADFSAGFNGNNLVLTSNFNRGKEYEAGIFNLSGQKVFSAAFQGGNNRQELDINTNVIPGIYMIYLTEKGNQQSLSILKVSKQ
jgi:hypothetical protein